jgi:hypothetical protein
MGVRAAELRLWYGAVEGRRCSKGGWKPPPLGGPGPVATGNTDRRTGQWHGRTSYGQGMPSWLSMMQRS